MDLSDYWDFCTTFCATNENVESYKRVYNAPHKNHFKVKVPGNNSLQLINKILESGVDITSDYKNWYQIGASLASEYGEGGRELFHKLSMASPKYKFSDCDKQYDKCLKNHGRYTIGTLFHYAKEFGISLRSEV